MNKKKAIIIGAGPAGLTAAYELITKTDIKPIVFEMTGDIGGISKTVNYKENRMDIGGHRFFSKSDHVMNWWTDLFPLQGKPARDDISLKRSVPLSALPDAPDPEMDDQVIGDHTTQQDRPQERGPEIGSRLGHCRDAAGPDVVTHQENTRQDRRDHQS